MCNPVVSELARSEGGGGWRQMLGNTVVVRAMTSTGLPSVRHRGRSIGETGILEVSTGRETSEEMRKSGCREECRRTSQRSSRLQEGHSVQCLECDSQDKHWGMISGDR